jgi:CRISPR-associated protein Cas5h
MQILAFELRGQMAHYRRPDTTASHVTYPFIPRTTLHGLLGSILGMENFEGDAWIGIRLLSPVKTVSQELSLLGKGWLGNGGDMFNRPTAVEFVVKPRYMIYFYGDHFDQLTDLIASKRSFFHTYLGSAFCLTFPEFRGVLQGVEEQIDTIDGEIECYGVIPIDLIEKVSIKPGSKYARVGGMHYQHIGERRFRGTINLLYDMEGGPVRFIPQPEKAKYPYKLCRLASGEMVCLW